MPWIIYLRFGAEAANRDATLIREAVLKEAEKFSQRIEQEENGCWIELRGPHTVFQVLRELKESSSVMALAPNKWLAKFLALNTGCLPSVTLGGSCYLWRRKKGEQEILWLGPGKAESEPEAKMRLTRFQQKVRALPQDFYPSLLSADEAWAAWFESKIWHDFPLEGLWFLEHKIIEKLARLGFQNLGQLVLLGDDFLIRETGNPFLPLFLKGREGLPGLEANYPSKTLEVFRELRDPETQSEGDWVQMAQVARELAFQLVEQLTARNEGCLRLRLTVSHAGESFGSERQFSAPEQDRLSLAETVLMMVQGLRLESFGEVRVEAEELRPAVHRQYALFAQAGKETRDPRLAALTLRFPGMLKKGVSLSRREKMLAHWDPWRF